MWVACSTASEPTTWPVHRGLIHIKDQARVPTKVVWCYSAALHSTGTPLCSVHWIAHFQLRSQAAGDILEMERLDSTTDWMDDGCISSLSVSKMHAQHRSPCSAYQPVVDMPVLQGSYDPLQEVKQTGQDILGCRAEPKSRAQNLFLLAIRTSSE